MFTKVISQLGTYSCTHGDRRTFHGMPPLTVIRVVAYDVVSSTPVPQKQGGISGAGHDVAVSSDVGLRPGQTRDHIPVAKNNLGQLSCGEQGGRQLSMNVCALYSYGCLTTRIKMQFKIKQAVSPV